MDCWNCGKTHASATGAIAAHRNRRRELENRITLVLHGNSSTKAETVSKLRAEIDEQDRIMAYLRTHDELPPQRVSL